MYMSWGTKWWLPIEGKSLKVWTGDCSFVKSLTKSSNNSDKGDNVTLDWKERNIF
jgi:hypothetical protein